MQHKCPNCGHDVEMPPIASPTGDYCPDCGALMTEFDSKISSWKVVLFTLLLGFILIGSAGMGIFGGCLILIGALNGNSSGGLLTGLMLPGALIVVAAFVVGALSVWGMTKIKK